jgi:hypothetical protein
MSNCTVAALDWFVRHTVNPWNPPRACDVMCPITALEQLEIAIAVLGMIFMIVCMQFQENLTKLSAESLAMRTELSQKQDKPEPQHECRCESCDKPLKIAVN